jgi:VWFA-related protein
MKPTFPLCGAALVIAFSAAAGQSTGQSPAAAVPVVENVDVRVVNVDVAAVDGSGKPISDLTASDFELYEDGKPQKLTNFAFVDRTVQSADAVNATDGQLRRRLILLVDNNYIEKRERNLALNKLDAFIDETFDGSYEWSVASLGQQLDVLQPFTTDKKLIHAAVAKIRKSATTSMRGDMADRSAVDDPIVARGSGEREAAVGFGGRERTTRNAQSLERTTRGLIDAARAFATTEGRKTAVLVTGAMDMSTSFSGYGQNDRETQDLKTGIARMIDTTVREANLASMSIHVLNTATLQTAALQHDVSNASSGLGGGATRMAGIGFTGATDTAETSTPLHLAEGTGGLYFARDVRESLEAIAASSARYYLLGYTPPHATDRQYHRITVKVKRHGARVAHRQGYVDLSDDERLEQLLKVRASLVQPARSLPVTLNVSNTPAADATKPVLSFMASMPMNRITLLPSNGGFSGRVHVYLSIFDSRGRNVGFHHKTQDVRFSQEQMERVLSDAFRYAMNIRLDRGDFTISVTMRDDLSREIGMAVQKIKL